jgi:hypothetical protein
MEGINSLTCTSRTKRIDYEEVRSKSVKVVGDVKTCIAWAYKFNIHGEKLKDDDSITVNGKTMTAAEFLTKLSAQDGWSEYQARRTAGTQKLGSKDLITVTRLARAFAGMVTVLIQKGIAKQSPDMLAIKATAKDCVLPDEFCFLNSPYGMKNVTLKENAAELRKFFVRFDEIIATAVEKKWIDKKSGSKHRNWAEDFDNYLLFRGDT